MRTVPLFAALMLTAGVLAPGSAEAQPQSCKLFRIDEWAVRPDIPTPVLEGMINGQRVGVVIDTGMAISQGALLERVLARRLGIPVVPYPNIGFGSIGSESPTGIGFVREIRIGSETRRDWRVFVAGEDHGQAGAFIIGNSFFLDYEVEFDLSRHQVRLFKSENCDGASLAYWTRSASEAPFKMDKGWISVKALLNGKPVDAVLDSGTPTSVIDTSVIARVGGESQRRAAGTGRCLRGFGKQAVASQIGEFDSFALADELIRNPKIYYADLRKDVPRDTFVYWQTAKFELPEMILGADFLRAHRILIAPKYGKLFFTYEGGTVFPVGPAERCSEQAVEPKQ